MRYDAIETCLRSLGRHAAKNKATVHMPRIGAGLGGGDWGRVLPLIEAMAKDHDLDVYVYTL